MTARVEIRCVNKSDRFNPYERIISVGGVAGDNTRWKLPQQRAIELIEAGRNSFYVNRSGNAVEVIIAVSQYGHKYLKTTADAEQPNNLLSLPECP